MSWHHVSWFWRQRGLTQAERLVGVALANAADPESDLARPGVDYLAWEVESSAGFVRSGLDGLVAKQLIEAATVGGGRGRPTVWRLLIPAEQKGPSREAFRRERVQKPSRNPTRASNGSRARPETETLPSPNGDGRSGHPLVQFFADECSRQGRPSLTSFTGRVAGLVRDLERRNVAEALIRRGIIRCVEVAKPGALKNLVAEIEGGQPPRARRSAGEEIASVDPSLAVGMRAAYPRRSR